MTLVSLARAANATIASKPASTAVPRKNDALRSLRTPGTESPRRVTPAQRPTDETYNRFGRFGVGTPRWHSSPRESELRNSHLGWIRFRGPVSGSEASPIARWTDGSVAAKIANSFAFALFFENALIPLFRPPRADIEPCPLKVGSGAMSNFPTTLLSLGLFISDTAYGQLRMNTAFPD